MVQELLHRYSTSEGYDIYPDVLPFFKQLRNTRSETSQWPFKNTVVGIITNSDDRVPGILDSFGLKIGPRRLGQADQRSEKATLEDDISFVVLSYDVGVEKPERKMFDAATDMLLRTLEGYEQNLKADSFERLYVGDELEKDYNGAQAAGWNAILLDRQHDPLSASASDLRWTSMKSKDGNEHKVLVAGSVADISKWRPSTTG